ncbi:MAG: radical SAM protein [Candidatus Omnitrophota bacterium]|nr:radical SAM protein [Candidatus Omnitrophota bacterium]
MKIKKALLFIPPAFTAKNGIDINPLPPLGLGYIAAVLESRDIDVKIYDCLIEGWDKREDIDNETIRIGSPVNEIERVIAEFQPDIVGVNNLFTKQRKNAHQIYEIAKQINRAIVTVAGGAHPTAMPELAMEDKNVDFVVLGEGESIITDLISCLEMEKDINTLNGIAFRDNGNVKIIPRIDFIQDLDSIPFPARHLLNMEKYFGLEFSHGKRRYRRFSPIITSRGCPAKCIFCSAHKVWGRGYRSRSPENVIQEMQQLRDRHGIEELLFEDDNVTLDVSRAERIFDLMTEEKFNFKWDTPNGVAAFALNERLIDKMKQAGCYKLNFAIESGNQEVLNNLIKKPLNLKKVKPLIKYAKSIGLDVGIFLILGVPGETLSQMWDSFRFVKEVGIYNPFVSIATPYPGSELYNLCLEKGYISKDYSLDNLHIKSFSISTENWTGEDIKKICQQSYFFLRREYYRSHPFLLFGKIIQKLFSNPIRLVKEIFSSIRIG